MRVHILILVLCFSCLLGVGTAVAQQDVFCVCLDSTDPTTCGGNVDVSPFNSVTVWLCILNPSGPQVAAWEALVEINSIGTWFGSWVLTRGLNFGSQSEYIVGIGDDPLQPNAAGAFVLMSIDLVVVDDDYPIEFFVKGIPGSLSLPDGPGYAWDVGQLVASTTCSGDPEIPVFTINGDPTTLTQWQVEIDATSGGVHDEGNLAGADLYASDGYNSVYDIPEPPPAPADYVSLYFPHPEWGSTLGDNFMTDIRADYEPDFETKVWPFTVDTDLTSVMTLSFTPDIGVESSWDIHLYDPVEGLVVDLRAQGFVYEYTPVAGEKVFELWIGPDVPQPASAFSVQIDALSNGIHDEGNVAGAAQIATDTYDTDHDIPEPPPAPADFVSLYFPHPEWGSPFGDNFMTDIRAFYDPGFETKVWPFVVETDLGTTMTLIFTPDVGVLSNWGVWLHDPVDGWVLDLRDQGWLFDYAPTGGAREFELWIGPGEPGPIPSFRDLPAGWSLIGIPLVPPSPGTIEAAILQGAAGTNFVFDHNFGQGYGLMYPVDQAQQGRGYWLGSDQGFNWEMPDGTPDTGEIQVSLNNGWTMLGYPLWMATHNSGVDVIRWGSTFEWDYAVNAGWITDVLYDYASVLDDYVTTEDFQTWYGYWVAAHEYDLALSFRHQNIVPPALAPKPSETPADTDWRLEVVVNDHPVPVAFGFRETSTDGFDARFDLPAPPRAPVAEPAAKLHFEHPEWNLAVGDAFITDFRPPIDPPYRWDAVLTAPEAGPVVLSWDSSVLARDTDLQVYLPHQNRVVVMSMFETSSVTLEVGDEPLQVTFRSPDLMTDVSDLPQRHEIACHPNPFNPVTEIELRTVSAGEVALEIYDLRGRQVRTFALGVQATGTYPVTWRGRDDAGRELAGGTYFAMLVLDGARTGAMAKLTLVK